ncbi:MAG: hypothetical protein RJB39_330 [Candidatus Parcubacteria bacterium]|jgi:hypothetical protein
MKKKLRKTAKKPASKPKAKKVKSRPKARPRPKARAKVASKPRTKKKVYADLKESIVSGTTPTEVAILEQLFGGSSKMKLWKVFFLNTTKEFTLKQLSSLTRLRNDKLIPDLRDLMRQGVVVANKKLVLIENLRKENHIVYKANSAFPLLSPLIETILAAVPRSAERVLEHVQSLPRLKTVLLSGFFTSKLGMAAVPFSTTQSPIDMLLIFEKIPSQVNTVLGELERNLGRELRYVALDQEDFKYRHSIGDKLIRDVLDFEHIIVMDRMGFFK